MERLVRPRVNPATAVAPKVEELLKTISERGRDAVQHTDYLGAAEMMRLAKLPHIARDCLEVLQLAMVSDLRKRILVIANEKALDGTIAIPIVLWSNGSEESEASEGSHARKAAEEEERVVKRIGFLTKNYKVQFWYFELLEMIRKLLMTSIVTFIYTGTPAQITAALVITLGFGLYTQRARPFADEKIGDMQVFSLVVQAFTLVYGLMLVIDELTTLLGLQQSFTQEAVRSAMGAFVVFLNTAVVAFPWVQKVLERLHAHLERRRRAKAALAADLQAKPAQATHCLAGHGREAAKWNNSVVDGILKMCSESARIPAMPSQVDTGPSGSGSWRQAAGIVARASESGPDRRHSSLSDVVDSELNNPQSAVYLVQPTLRVEARLGAPDDDVATVLRLIDEAQVPDAWGTSAVPGSVDAHEPSKAAPAEPQAEETGQPPAVTAVAGDEGDADAAIPGPV